MPVRFKTRDPARHQTRIGRPGRRQTDNSPDQVAAETMMARRVRRRQRHRDRARP